MKSSVRAIRSLLRSHVIAHPKALIIGIFSIFMVDCADLFLPLILKDMVDSFESGKSLELVRSSFYAVAMVVAAQVMGRYLWRVSLARASHRSGARLRQEFSRQIFEIHYSYFDRRSVGDLMTLATSDVENMRVALGPGLISLIDAFFFCLTIPVGMYFIAPDITWQLLLPVAGVPVIVILLQKRIAGFSRRVQERIGALGTQTQETIAGVRLVKIYGAQDRLSERLRKQSHRLNEAQVSLSKTQAFFGPSLEFFLSISLLLLFRSALTGTSIGTLVALQRYLQKLMWPMSAIGLGIIYFLKARESGREYFSFIEEPKVESIESGKASPLPAHDPRIPIIEAKNLNFRVIQNWSFQVREGEWVGIQGNVASGKSTLFSLLLKFYDPPRGQLFVLGKDILDWNPNEVREYFTSVLQDPYLFRGSIASNLEVGDELDIRVATEIAGIPALLMDTRKDEDLGEKGTGLSGGQKQRVAIARALRKRAPILLLDDPLSSVDLSTSERVLEKLHSALKKKNKTVMFASHHPEHLLYCDRVLKLAEKTPP